MRQQYFMISKISLGGLTTLIFIFFLFLFMDIGNLIIALPIKLTNYSIGLCAIGILILSIVFLQSHRMKSGILIGIFADIILGYFFIITLYFYFISQRGFFYFIPSIMSLLWLFNTSIYFILFFSKLKENESNTTKIKRTVIDLGTKYTRLSLGDISEKCGENTAIVLETIKDMIKNSEINAKYFRSSRMVAFDQQANIDDFDKLMKSFEEWENDQQLKKL
ncbi:MAG: hypothetical protein GF311_17720 [Candidatus Lokiarchaeota archaeon]|nr:hypothetical protein [Candidatus Lokiarchaeota archaeon]